MILITDHRGTVHGAEWHWLAGTVYCGRPPVGVSDTDPIPEGPYDHGTRRDVTCPDCLATMRRDKQ